MEAPMDVITRLEGERACADVVTRYAMAVNGWDLDAFVALFTDDAVWQRPAFPEMKGHAAIRAFMASQPTERVLRHVNGGILANLIDEATASVWSQTTVYESPGSQALPAPLSGPDMIVEYRDHMVKAGDHWLIARRDTTVVFKAGV
jgi:uncharacterized protein (TIGR02246 family)